MRRGAVDPLPRPQRAARRSGVHAGRTTGGYLDLCSEWTPDLRFATSGEAGRGASGRVDAASARPRRMFRYAALLHAVAGDGAAAVVAEEFRFLDTAAVVGEGTAGIEGDRTRGV